MPEYDDIPWLLAADALNSPASVRELLEDFVSQVKLGGREGEPLAHDAYVCFLAHSIEKYLKSGNWEGAVGLTKRGRPKSHDHGQDYDIWSQFKKVLAQGHKYEVAVATVSETTRKSGQYIKRVVNEHERARTRIEALREKVSVDGLEKIQVKLGYRPAK